jgi:hypothetical protein
MEVDVASPLNGLNSIAEGQWLVYPNPFSEIAIVEVPENFIGSEIQLCDATARVIWHSRISGSNVIFNWSHISAGIYTLKILNASSHETLTKRIVKQ